MTNATRVMVQEGFRAGFKRLYAKVKWGNDHSAAVLKRLQFTENKTLADHEYNVFESTADDFENK